jgi:hypothetical protein
MEIDGTTLFKIRYANEKRGKVTTIIEIVK